MLLKMVQNIVCNTVFIIVYSNCEYCLILSTILFYIVCNIVQNIVAQIYVSIVHDIASYCSILLNTLFNVRQKSTYTGFFIIVSLLR